MKYFKIISVDTHFYSKLNLFAQIDLNRDDAVDWHEFISFLLYEFCYDDPSNQRENLTLPISRTPKSFSANHRSNLISIQFTPFVNSVSFVEFQVVF